MSSTNYSLALHDALPIYLTRLVAAIGDLVGNHQSNQTLIQIESTTSATLARLQVQTAAYERAQSVEKLAEPRSEEHTSELQSLAYLVCRLLLEKKKTITM